MARPTVEQFLDGAIHLAGKPELERPFRVAVTERMG